MLSQCGRTLSACLWQHRASRLLDLVRCLFCLSSPCHFWKPQRLKSQCCYCSCHSQLPFTDTQKTTSTSHFFASPSHLCPPACDLESDLRRMCPFLKCISRRQSLQEELPFIDNPNYGCWSCYEHCFIYLTEAIIQ